LFFFGSEIPVMAIPRLINFDGFDHFHAHLIAGLDFQRSPLYVFLDGAIQAADSKIYLVPSIPDDVIDYRT